MKFFLLIPLLFVLACGSIGTVDRQATADLFKRVGDRVEAYVAAGPNQADPVLLDIQVAARALDGPDERIAAGPVRKSIERVCKVHDDFVTSDDSINETKRGTYLRSTQLLRALMLESEATPVAETRRGD